MNFDLYEFLKYHNGSKFYPVKVEEIDELEKKLNLIVPKELKDLLLGIGYGFIIVVQLSRHKFNLFIMNRYM